jgi:hypothetical protein
MKNYYSLKCGGKEIYRNITQVTVSEVIVYLDSYNLLGSHGISFANGLAFGL